MLQHFWSFSLRFYTCAHARYQKRVFSLLDLVLTRTHTHTKSQNNGHTLVNMVYNRRAYCYRHFFICCVCVCGMCRTVCVCGMCRTVCVCVVCVALCVCVCVWYVCVRACLPAHAPAGARVFSNRDDYGGEGNSAGTD